MPFAEVAGTCIPPPAKRFPQDSACPVRKPFPKLPPSTFVRTPVWCGSIPVSSAERAAEHCGVLQKAFVNRTPCSSIRRRLGVLTGPRKHRRLLVGHEEGYWGVSAVEPQRWLQRKMQRKSRRVGTPGSISRSGDQASAVSSNNSDECGIGDHQKYPGHLHDEEGCAGLQVSPRGQHDDAGHDSKQSGFCGSGHGRAQTGALSRRNPQRCHYEYHVLRVTLMQNGQRQRGKKAIKLESEEKCSAHEPQRYPSQTLPQRRCRQHRQRHPYAERL